MDISVNCDQCGKFVHEAFCEVCLKRQARKIARDELRDPANTLYQAHALRRAYLFVRDTTPAPLADSDDFWGRVAAEFLEDAIEDASRVR